MKDFKEQINRYERLLKSKGIVFKEFKESTSNMENLKDSLPKINWHLIVLNSLRERDSIATTKNIYNISIKDKPELNEYNRTRIIAKLSGVLTLLEKKGIVKKIDNKLGKGKFWLLSEWCEEGKIKQEYKDKLIEEYKVNEYELFGEI